MRTHDNNGGSPGRQLDQRTLLVAAVFLLKVEREEELGLNHRNAVLAAAAAAGVNPAAVLSGSKEVIA